MKQFEAAADVLIILSGITFAEYTLKQCVLRKGLISIEAIQYISDAVLRKDTSLEVVSFFYTFLIIYIEEKRIIHVFYQ